MPDVADQRTLRARFKAEVEVGGITPLEEDHEPLFAMWADALRYRDTLLAADVAAEEEPSFIEKPTVLRGEP